MRVLKVITALCTCCVLSSCFGQIRRVPLGTSIRDNSSQNSTHEFCPLLDESTQWEAYPIPYVENELNFSPINHQTVTLEGTNGASGTYTPIEYDANKEPWLTWSWSLQKRGDTDYPFALLIGFDIPGSQATPQVLAWADETEESLGVRPPLRAIAYVFGGSLPSDIAQSPFFAPHSIFTINLRGNIDCTGKEFQETRNILHDYQALFHSTPPQASMLALVGDARGENSSLNARFSSPEVSPHTPTLEAAHADPIQSTNPLIWGVLMAAALVALTSGTWLLRRFLRPKSE